MVVNHLYTLINYQSMELSAVNSVEPTNVLKKDKHCLSGVQRSEEISIFIFSWVGGVVFVSASS